MSTNGYTLFYPIVLLGLFLPIGALLADEAGDSSRSGRPKLNQLDDFVPTYAMKDGTIHDVFAPLGMNFNVGFVLSPATQWGKEKRITMTLTSTTVRGVLDALMAADTSYYWIEDGGVINFIPKTIEPGYADIAAKLEERVPKFKVRGVSLAMAQAELIAQARSQGIIGISSYSTSSARISERNDERAYIIRPSDRISLNLKDKTLRECFNAIITAWGSGNWLAMYAPEGIRIMATSQRVHGTPRKQHVITQDEIPKYIEVLKERTATEWKLSEGKLDPKERRALEKRLKKLLQKEKVFFREYE